MTKKLSLDIRVHKTTALSKRWRGGGDLQRGRRPIFETSWCPWLSRDNGDHLASCEWVGAGRYCKQPQLRASQAPSKSCRSWHQVHMKSTRSRHQVVEHRRILKFKKKQWVNFIWLVVCNDPMLRITRHATAAWWKLSSESWCKEILSGH